MRLLTILTLAAVMGLVAAAPRPQGNDRSSLNRPPSFVDYRVGPDADGNFFFRYNTGDGIIHEARGVNSGDGIVRVSGSYSYVSPEGQPISVSYTADENGYQTQQGVQSPFLPDSPSSPPRPAFVIPQESGGHAG